MEEEKVEVEAAAPPASVPPNDDHSPPTPRFDPTRMIGIIKRKTLIKDLAAAYQAECLAYCQELLELQQKLEEPYVEIKTPNNSRRETMRPTKRVKKSH